MIDDLLAICIKKQLIFKLRTDLDIFFVTQSVKSRSEIVYNTWLLGKHKFGNLDFIKDV